MSLANVETADLECDSCGFVNPIGGLWEYTDKVRESKNLCILCANTYTGLAVSYPEQYKGQEKILRSTCWIGNCIRKDIANLLANIG